MTAPKRERPTQPYGVYKLRYHANGQIYKKHKGEMHYLGPWDQPEQAEIKFGRILRSKSEGVEVFTSDDLILAELVTLFFESKEREVARGSLNENQLKEYKRLCQLTVDAIGRSVLVTDLGPQHFAKLRQKLDSLQHSPTTLQKKITQIRAIFNWAMRNEFTGGKFISFGDELQVPSMREIRLFKDRKQKEQGLRMFEASEIRQLLDAADERLTAAIWLGVNCGYGHADLSHLKTNHIDFENGWASLIRSKTGVPRRAKMIPECIEAVKKVVDGDEVFRIKPGHRDSDLVGRLFRELQRQCGTWRRGRNFYGLRHSCRTALDGLGDSGVCDAIMGHADRSMGGQYVNRIDDARFERAAEHLRSWLLES